MGMVIFYHLTQSSAETTARTVLDRALGQGWRIMIRGKDEAALRRLDERLWLMPEDSFVPHGLQGGSQDADQPVLLGMGAITNGAQALMLIDGAEADEGEVRSLERVWILFDGGNQEQLAKARGQWKRITDAGLAAQYWSEETGRWEKKAEKGAV